MRGRGRAGHRPFCSRLPVPFKALCEELAAVAAIGAALEPLSREVQVRVLLSAAAFYGIDLQLR